MKIKQELKDEYDSYVKKNSKDPYSRAVVDFAEQWAREMEKSMNKGITLAEIAETACSLVDSRPGFGITGYMYGASVSALSYFWEHGEELRSWHNAKYSTKKDIEGTINPAIVTIG